MKSLIIVIVALLSVVVSPTTTMGGWPKPSEVFNEEKLMNAGHPQPHVYAGKFNFGDSKLWKCTYNNGSGVAVSITYPSPPQAPSQKPTTPSSPPSPKMAPPPPKPSPPRPTPNKSPPPPTPSPPPPTPSPPPPTPIKSPLPPKPSPPPPTPIKSPPPPKPSPPPPTPKMSPPSPTPSPPPSAPKESTPPPNPSSPPLPKTSILIIPSPPPPHEPIPAQSPPKEPTTPSTPLPPYQNWNPLGHFIDCMTEYGPSIVCKQQVEISYYTGRFRVSDYCCNLFVNIRNECSDVIVGLYNDPCFLPLLRYTCHVKIY